MKKERDIIKGWKCYQYQRLASLSPHGCMKGNEKGRGNAHYC